jgi:hypothetical protein
LQGFYTPTAKCLTTEDSAFKTPLTTHPSHTTKGLKAISVYQIDRTWCRAEAFLSPIGGDLAFGKVLISMANEDTSTTLKPG